jgi:hypothetical protein
VIANLEPHVDRFCRCGAERDWLSLWCQACGDPTFSTYAEPRAARVPPGGRIPANTDIPEEVNP